LQLWQRKKRKLLLLIDMIDPLEDFIAKFDVCIEGYVFGLRAAARNPDT
jgi:hypothetical protein